MIFSLTSLFQTLTDQGIAAGFDSFSSVLILYLLMSWMICIAAAFCKVKEVTYSAGLIAMGLSLMVAFVIGGLFRNYYPDLAASFTPAGLFSFSLLVGLLVCCVPLVQFFWDISYWRGMACVVGGIAILLVAYVGFQVIVRPPEQLPARLSVPLFQDGRSPRR